LTQETEVTATRLLLWTGVAILAATLDATAATGSEPVVSVRERDGAYVIAASFTVPAGAAVVRDVLTDYASIPRFMPGVETSRVLDRGDGRLRVEQEAVSRYMMFSKRVHLVLDIEEDVDAIRFRDRCNRSFSLYEGVWTIATTGTSTELTYELTAKPAFGVPGFVLRKLLDRDARAMIDGLRDEIGARARRVEF
jgi:ribosome-associated toxin RatA of RatAB toxin-antitoxin module